MNTTVNTNIINEALNLNGSTDALRRFYSRWAPAYDADVEREQYRAPATMVALLERLPAILGAGRFKLQSSSPIMDAGCGTGLVGAALQRRGFVNVEGCDLSLEMVARADQCGTYRRLVHSIDLNRRNPELASGHYAVTLCCGTFTQGHVPPEALAELLRITDRQGVVIVSTRQSYCKETACERTWRRFEDQGWLRLLHCERDAPYLDAEDAHYWVFGPA